MTPGGPRRGRLARYALWQLRDFVIERGAATLIVGFFLGTQFVLPLRMSFGPAWARTMDDAVLLGRVLAPAVGAFGVLGSLVAVNGIISNDRKYGYYRFLFAKPVSVARYYAQAFLAHLAGLLAATAALFGLFAVLVRPVSPLGALAAVALSYLAIGGVGFLLSALVRFDWLALAVVLTAAGFAQLLYGDAAGWRGALARSLPPVGWLDDVVAPLMRGAAPPASAALWLAGYGAACFLLGLLVVRRRPLAA